jgi:hypothetical protein
VRGWKGGREGKEDQRKDTVAGRGGDGSELAQLGKRSLDGPRLRAMIITMDIIIEIVYSTYGVIRNRDNNTEIQTTVYVLRSS